MKTIETFDEVLAEQMKDPEFKEEFDRAAVEYVSFKNALNARKEAGLTQEAIARKMGTTQSAVARLENKLSLGQIPSHASLIGYAKAMGKKVVINFV